MSKIIFLDAVRKQELLKKSMKELSEENSQNQLAPDFDQVAYQAKILVMDRIELLEEMVRFQEERTRVGKLDFHLILQGQILFLALEKSAETDELKSLVRSYRKHLDLELKTLLKSQAQG
jgi:hypothetical protein